MFGKRIPLFRLFDFEVRLDISWIIIAVLVTWSLARGLFPSYYEGLREATYWWMGVAGALGLFGSIIFHELAHSLVARRFGMMMKGITLFVFGGVAEMDEEPPSAKAEFFMAIAGPIASVVLGFVFWGLTTAGRKTGIGGVLIGVLDYLCWINFILAFFNCVPAFPLDGGRILRSALWYWKGNIRWATRIASGLGSAFGFFLTFMGVLLIFNGAFVSGLWWFLIGLFVNSASQMSYRRLLFVKTLKGEPVRRFMRNEVVSVSPDITVEDLVNDYVYRYHYKFFPVMDDGKLVGCVSTRNVKDVSQDEWAYTPVEKVMQPCAGRNAVRADDDATKALGVMHRNGQSRLLVLNQEGNLAGIISLKDMLKFLSLKIDLEGDEFDTE